MSSADGLAGSSSQAPRASFQPSTVQAVLQWLVLVIGLIGTIGNVVVIALLVGSKNLPRKSKNLLILNQLAVDFYSCVCLVVTYSYKIASIYIPSSDHSRTLCYLLGSEMMLWIGLNGSTISLVFIATERYVKIVHPMTHRKYYRAWMTYGSVLLTWISGVLLTVPVTLATTVIEGGSCDAYLVWQSSATQKLFGGVYYLLDFLGPTVWFVYSYWHISSVIRGRVAAQGGGGGAGAAGAQSKAATQQEKVARLQLAGVKTVVLIALLFIVCWTPNQIYFLMMNIGYDLSQLTDAWYGTLFFAFITICAHPFIYAGSIEGVKKSLLRFRTKVSALTTAGVTGTQNEVGTARTVSVIALNALDYTHLHANYSKDHPANENPGFGNKLS